jgi:hypothetical protein
VWQGALEAALQTRMTDALLTLARQMITKVMADQAPDSNEEG